MKVYMVDGRVGEVDLTEKALVALHNSAVKNRLGMPTQVKIDGHFEFVSITSIDILRTVDQPKTIVGWEGYQRQLPKVK